MLLDRFEMRRETGVKCEKGRTQFRTPSRISDIVISRYLTLTSSRRNIGKFSRIKGRTIETRDEETGNATVNYFAFSVNRSQQQVYFFYIRSSPASAKTRTRKETNRLTFGGLPTGFFPEPPAPLPLPRVLGVD